MKKVEKKTEMFFRRNVFEIVRKGSRVFRHHSAGLRICFLTPQDVTKRVSEVLGKLKFQTQKSHFEIFSGYAKGSIQTKEV